MVTIYLMRTCANNSTYALQKSILMDFVPKVLQRKLSSANNPFPGPLCVVPSMAVSMPPTKTQRAQ